MVDFIQRSVFPELLGHLAKKEISLIVGPRQAGKTTIMKKLEKVLQAEGKPTMFLNLDVEGDRPFFQSQEYLLRRIRLEFGKKPGVVFIDEIQRKPDAGLFLKGLYDLDLPHKFIVSGSGSLELKEKIHESLVGRKRVFEVSTLSFHELVDFRTDYRFSGKLSEFFETDTARSHSLLLDYLNFGGYPRVVAEAEEKEKRALIDEIFSSYLERDIAALLRVEKTEAFGKLIRLLGGQTGQLVNYSELGSNAALSLPTVKHFIWYAQKTFVICPVFPFFRNPRKEITKSPCVYFHDLGLLNHSVGRFGNLQTSTDLGFVFQNMVFLILRDLCCQTGMKLNFWRTTDQAEVDFVLSKGKEVLPIEVKFKDCSEPRLSRSFRSFIEKYSPEKALVVNLTLNTRTKIGKTEVSFLPYFHLFTHRF